MGAEQGELMTLQVIVVRHAPGVIAMALIAPGSEAAGMRIRRVVATTAVLWDPVLVVTASMATKAIDLRMGTEQRVTRLLQMVETRSLPLGRIVAVATGITARAAMHVVRGMASMAGFWRGRITPSHVAGIAGQLLVRSIQHEAGACVVEACVAPTLDGVTLAARLPELLLVYVVVPMALAACGRNLLPGLGGKVAATAGLRRMRTLQWKFGQGMIELGSVQLDDIGVTTFVLAMAGPTFAVTGIGHASVIPVTRPNIEVDVLMAVQAQRRLSSHVAAVVAVGAVLLLPDMGCRQFPGHQQSLY